MTAELASAFAARDFVGLLLGSNGLAHLSDDVRLVVSELVTNAVQHARTPFTVVLQRRGSCVTLTVRDLSPSLPVMAAQETMGSDGRGLVIVDVLSDDWGVTRNHDGSKSVWAAFPAEADVAASR